MMELADMLDDMLEEEEEAEEDQRALHATPGTWGYAQLQGLREELADTGGRIPRPTLAKLGKIQRTLPHWLTGARMGRARPLAAAAKKLRQLHPDLPLVAVQRTGRLLAKRHVAPRIRFASVKRSARLGTMGSTSSGTTPAVRCASAGASTTSRAFSAYAGRTSLRSRTLSPSESRMSRPRQR